MNASLLLSHVFTRSLRFDNESLDGVFITWQKFELRRRRTQFARTQSNTFTAEEHIDMTHYPQGGCALSNALHISSTFRRIKMLMTKNSLCSLNAERTFMSIDALVRCWKAYFKHLCDAITQNQAYMRRKRYVLHKTSTSQKIQRPPQFSPSYHPVLFRTFQRNSSTDKHMRVCSTTRSLRK